MEKAPTTQKTLGIAHDYGSDQKFRTARDMIKAIAKDDEINRHIRAKKKYKKNKVEIPKYKIGEKIILQKDSYRNGFYYYLVEVIDFEEHSNGNFTYYGILFQTTDKNKLDRRGRLVTFEDNGWLRQLHPANVPPDSIKNWITR